MTFVKKCGVILLGILFVILIGQGVRFDTCVENTQVTLAYAGLAVIALLTGPVVTPIVAFGAHFLSDGLTYTTVWWTWIVAEGVFGLMLGLIAARLDLLKHPFSWSCLLQFNIWQGIANLLVWGLIAPLGDFLVYQSGWEYVLMQGLVAAFWNFIVIGIFGTAFVYIYHIIKRK